MRAGAISNITPNFSVYQPPDKPPEVQSAEAPPRQLCSPQFEESITSPLKILFNPKAEGIHQYCQKNRLHAWFPDKENLSVNSAVSEIPIDDSPEKPQRKRAIEAGMGNVFQAVQPNVWEMPRPPQAIVVPLGLHALNAVRIASLKEACDKLRERFGHAALQSMHVYFVGGRKLSANEKAASLREVMNFGLNAHCSADWKRLDEGSRDAFLMKFEATATQKLGQVKSLPKDETSAGFGETDSAKHLWTHAPGLNELSQSLEGRVHFIEAGSNDYKSDGRDSTHGNALLFLEHYFTIQQNESKGSSVWVCSDNIFCPRASLIFKGYCDQYEIDVAPFSSPMSGNDDQLPSLAYLLPLTVRESACMLNEVVQCEQFKKKDQNWFDTQQLNEKKM
jgi:hypothetical protein